MRKLQKRMNIQKHIDIIICINICIYTYAQRPHQDLPFINTSDLNNIQPPSLNYIPLHCADHIFIFIYVYIYIHIYIYVFSHNCI